MSRVTAALYSAIAQQVDAGFDASCAFLANLVRVLEEMAADEGRPVDAPFPGTLGVSPLHDPLLEDDPLADSYLLSYTDFLTPDSLYLGTTRDDTRTLLKSRTALFDAEERLRVAVESHRGQRAVDVLGTPVGQTRVGDLQVDHETSLSASPNSPCGRNTSTRMRTTKIHT